MDSKDLLVMVFLFLVAFFVWSLPFQTNELPFGEGDSAWHFAVGDYQHSIGRTISRLPMFIEYWYYGFNPLLGPQALQYPPSMHVDYALMQFAGRFVPVFIFKATTSFIGAIAVYFLISRLYNRISAFVASFALVFSFREISLYLWGQQPTLTPYIYLPLILYSFYKYLTGYYNNEHKPVYLYLTVLLLSAQYLFHLQTVFTSVIAVVFFTAFMVIRNKKLPVSRNSVKHLIISAVIFIIVALPFLKIYVGASQAEKVGFEIYNPGRLFSWVLSPGLVQGAFPPAFVSFAAEYSLLLLPFILLGLLFLILRRSSEDLLLLAWFASVYLTLHTDVFMGAEQLGRVARALVVEPPLFFSLAALSPLLVASFVRKYSSVTIYSISLLLLLLIIVNILIPNYNYLASAYAGISRMTPAQYDFAVWAGDNLPENAVVFDWGTLTYPKVRWMLPVSHRYVARKDEVKKAAFDWHNNTYYLLLDYSDIALVGDVQMVQELQGFEKSLGRSPVFDRGNMRLYGVNRDEVPP